jgi:hypothetical protein
VAAESRYATNSPCLKTDPNFATAFDRVYLVRA